MFVIDSRKAAIDGSCTVSGRWFVRPAMALSADRQRVSQNTHYVNFLNQGPLGPLGPAGHSAGRVVDGSQPIERRLCGLRWPSLRPPRARATVRGAQ